MKKNLLSILSVAMLIVSAIACNSKDEAKTPASAAKSQPKATSSKVDLPNYRYVDIDTVLAKYNLAIDYSEEMLRLQNNMESEAKKHESSIKSFANSMQSKYQNNQYTEDSYKADERKMQQMQSNAASSLDKLQRSAADAAMAGEKVVQDSIKNFIKVYNEAHHYEAIFLKAATLYIDPRLDITDEVVEGLNARYNKVKK
ncbi:MAG: OmpH family outer membrane protein [Muribaculaceae bacterium]|nr:OmpH family outer membrane protein [Muribaculaceae bacterium]MDE6559483.1 OmpH family outer membrane protein [Muribaculaceae bacterium]